jgi:putative aldouronate transport system substrate-binding protein
MKRSIALLLSMILVLALIIPASAISSIAVKGIKLDTNKITLTVGKSYKLKVKLTPANTTQRALTFVSGNKKVASVDKTGNITGVGKGTTTISVFTVNKKYVAKCKVSVSEIVLEWKSDTSPVTLTAFNDNPSESSSKWGEDKVSKAITQRTGVTVNVRNATTIDHQEFNLLLASNNLPDFFIVNANQPQRGILINQGFVQPLNTLINKYCPNMMKIMPKDEAKFYTEDDGNFYTVVYFYSDIDRVSKLGSLPKTSGALTMNMKTWKDLGSPAYKTLDDYKKLLLKVKAKHPEITYPAYDLYSGNVDRYNNMAQLINRVYGGGNVLAKGSNNTIHLNFRDASYKKAVEYINSLYLDGLYNPENLTLTQASQFRELMQNGKIFSIWGSNSAAVNLDATEKNPFEPAVPPKATGYTLKLHNDLYSIGGNKAVFISKQCKNPARAIKYLEFMMSDEGQLLQAYGIEGEDYTINKKIPFENGAIEYTDSANALMNDWQKYVDTIGAYNNNNTWLLSKWADGMIFNYLEKAYVRYQQIGSVNDKYANNEQYADLLTLPADSDAAAIKAKIIDLWGKSLPKMYLATSKAQCDTAYNDFVNSALKLGLVDLEKAYTDLYKKWQKKLK